MGMAKIPIRMSWAKITWHGKKKRKEKKNEERKIMTIRKDNKWMILLLLKLKTINYFHMGIGTFQSFIKFKKKRHENHKVQKSKYWDITRWSVSLLSFVRPIERSLIYINALHVSL